MGIFGETVALFNRTPKALNITLRCQYDGKTEWITPGMNPHFPKVAVPYAKRQNPVKGSEDPDDPTPTGWRSLVAVPGGPDPGDDLPEMTMEEWHAHLQSPQRLNRELANQDLQYDKRKHEVLRGKPAFPVREARAHIGVHEAD